MLKLPNCDFCKNRIGTEDKCKAFPNGIPLETMIKDNEGEECGNGYFFVEVNNSSGSIEEEGLLSRMIDVDKD